MASVDSYSYLGAERDRRDAYTASVPATNEAGWAGAYRQFGKRAFDIWFVVLLAPFAVPVLAVLAFVVMRDGAHPFFGHERVGRDGRKFHCWKLRTMVPDSQERLRAHLEADPEARAEWEANFKLRNDPRITRIGNFLRRSSLDELPQLWNILKGEMSVVGPRPVTHSELSFYGAALRHYVAMRPGLTGLWQISGRNDVSYRERVVLDTAYARRHHFLLDLRIVFGTALAVLKRTGC